MKVYQYALLCKYKYKNWVKYTHSSSLKEIKRCIKITKSLKKFNHLQDTIIVKFKIVKE